MNSEPLNAYNVFFRPIIPLLLFLIVGIWIGMLAPGHAIWAHGAIYVLVAVLAGLILKRRQALGIPLILFGLAGYLILQPWVAPRFPSHHVVHFAGTKLWTITGVIDETPRPYARGVRVIVKTETLKAYKQNDLPTVSVTGKVRLSLVGDVPELVKGYRITIAGRLKKVRGLNNPGGFNYRRYMAFRKVWVTSYVPLKRLIAVEKKRSPKNLFDIDLRRRKVGQLIDSACQGDSQKVLKALVIGDRNEISGNLRNIFNRAGVGHLLAISGLHIGIVASVVFLFAVWVFSYIKLFLREAWTRKAGAITAMMTVVFYGLLAGMSPSTQRAVIMVAVFLLTYLIGRRQDSMNTVAIAALIILIIDPPALFSISFQLSFAAVVSIIYGLNRFQIAKRLNQANKSRQWLLRVYAKFGYVFMISVLALGGTLPLAMFYFNQISLIGPIANLVIVPLIGFLVVPLGLFSAFLSLFSTSAALLGIKIGAQILSASLVLVNIFAEWPYASIRTVTPTPFEIGLYYLLFGALVSVGARHRSEHSSRSYGQDVSKTRLAKVLIVIALIAGSIDAGWWAYHRFGHKDLRVTMIDVGQGGATLLELPKGKNLLIDGGGFSDNSVFDVGARVVAPLLWRNKIKTIDTLILSHPNSDHLNGLLYIAKHFKVKEVWTNNEEADTLGYKRFLEIVREEDIRVPNFKRLLRDRNMQGVRLQILYPPADFLEKRQKEKWRNSNNNSLVIKVSFGTTALLFPGDIMVAAEKELINVAGNRLKSTILIAPHHGSRSSSTPAFLNRVQPASVVISSGAQQSYYLPHPSVIARYKERGYRIFRTNQNGAIVITTDGREIKIKSTVH
ncbi:MAG: DNA internalization-related competence protein ComEC/Rec2 [Desulfobacterales bacterium]